MDASHSGGASLSWVGAVKFAAAALALMASINISLYVAYDSVANLGFGIFLGLLSICYAVWA